MKHLLLAASLIAATFSAQAQITIMPAGNAANIATFLSGSGVTISNVVVTADPQAIAYFTAINTPLNMQGGLMLSTGLCDSAAGANSSSSCSYYFANGFTDPDLTAIEPSATFDVAMLEFDCTPNDDTLYFNYLFGSEEYPEFVNSFNDVFGIFVTGANPAGGNYQAQNMALLNNGTVPVSINNVNNGVSNTGPCVNCADYVDNTLSTMLEYDGTTTNQMAILPVTPLSSYHIKIAIADANDGVYDSGVFLQAGSFRTSNTPTGINTAQRGETSISPNPAGTFFTLSLAAPASATTPVELMDLTGKVVLSETLAAATAQARIDVSDLANGIYVLRFSENGTVVTKRIAVQHP